LIQPSSHIDSYYTASSRETRGEFVEHSRLQDHINADVCVIGGGYTGLSSALHLVKKGYSVALLEGERIGWGASGRNGGHCSTGQRMNQRELEMLVGLGRAKVLWEYGLEAVQTVRDLIAEHDIQCDLKNGDLHVANRVRELPELQQEVEHMRSVYNYEHLQFCDLAEIREMVGSEKFYGGLLDTKGAHLHPLKYVLGLADAATKGGVKLFENSRVLSYRQTGSAAHSGKVKVTTGEGEVTADFVVLACNGYLERLSPSIAGKIMPINNFILATEPLEQKLATELIRDDVAVADSLFVINYWKLSADNRLLFGGGETYTSQFPADIKKFVRKYMLRVYPQLENIGIDYAWGGTLAITMNRLPVFGNQGGNIFYAHGYSGHGVPTATFAGKLIAEAVSCTAERFDVMAGLPNSNFPGGTLLRWPGLVAGMLYYSLRDRL